MKKKKKKFGKKICVMICKGGGGVYVPMGIRAGDWVGYPIYYCKT